MEAPELALPGRHTVTFKLPASIVSKGYWNKGKSYGFFALGGIGFHTSSPATGAVVRVTRVSMRYRARPADALALELDTGTLPRIVTPDAASRGVKVVVRNVTDRALAFDVALRLTDVRDDDAGWSLSERMAFGPGEAKTFTCPVPARYGTYYVNMTVCPPGGGMLDESERQRAFAHFRPVGATPEVKDAPGFYFGSVCHLNPYFGNEAEIARMADAMALVGLKIVRTEARRTSRRAAQPIARRSRDTRGASSSGRCSTSQTTTGAASIPCARPATQKSPGRRRPTCASWIRPRSS